MASSVLGATCYKSCRGGGGYRTRKCELHVHKGLGPIGNGISIRLPGAANTSAAMHKHRTLATLERRRVKDMVWVFDSSIAVGSALTFAAQAVLAGNAENIHCALRGSRHPMIRPRLGEAG